MKKIIFFVLFSLLFFQGFSQTNNKTLVLGDISNKPAKKIARFAPLADYLEEKLAAYNISEVKVNIAPSTDSMIRFFREKKVDIYFDSVYPALKVSLATDAEILLRRWKDGIGDYNSVIFSNVNSGVKTLDDLKGKVIAFEDINSSSGFLMPYAHIKEKGYILSEAKVLEAPLSSDKIFYFFARTDKNILQWVLDGKVPAGVIDSNEFLKIPEASIDKFNIIDETKSVPRQVVVFRKGLDPELRDKVIDVLKNMDKDIIGKRILNSFKNTLKFDDISESGDNFMNDLYRMYKLVEQQ